MSGELEKSLIISEVFVPSHLIRGLVATGISLMATGIAIGAGGYAIKEFSKTNLDEIVALVKP